MDLSSLAERIQKSKLLRESERDYWILHLPTMSQEQLQKLERIIGEAETLPLENKNVQIYLSLATKS